MKSPKPSSAMAPSGATGQVPQETDDDGLSSLKDHLASDMERQIQTLHHELLLELEDMVRKHDNLPQQQSLNTLGSLIHTITDSKLHKLNLELRQHMTARLDALLQDMKDEQKAFQTGIREELEQRLRPPNLSPRKNHTLSAVIRANLPALMAGLALVLMLISWPG
ncbi:MAG: hypothetical protein VYA55_16425 [Pseudomonadota bacterium]|nr:hypothetical protein [Pseudomonadota bacterium]